MKNMTGGPKITGTEEVLGYTIIMTPEGREEQRYPLGRNPGLHTGEPGEALYFKTLSELLKHHGKDHMQGGGWDWVPSLGAWDRLAIGVVVRRASYEGGDPVDHPYQADGWGVRNRRSGVWLDQEGKGKRGRGPALMTHEEAYQVVLKAPRYRYLVPLRRVFTYETVVEEVEI